MTTREVLLAARARIEHQARWTTGVPCDVGGRVCALGAIGVALWGEDFLDHLHGDAYERLAKEPSVAAIDAAMGHTEGDDITACIVEFNDEASTAEHHAKVLAAFDKAIAEAGE